MAIYINGNKKIKNIFADINGEKKSVSSVWVNQGSVPAKVFSAKNASVPAPASWADATNEEITNILNDHYAGVINIADYWNIGDTRTIHLSSMGSWQAGTDKKGETHSAQDVEIVIIGFNTDDLAAPISGKTKAAITVQLKQALSNSGMIDYDFEQKRINKISYTSNWTSCQRRAWANTVFKESLPDSIRPLLKEVKKTAYGMHSSVTAGSWDFAYRIETYSYDYCFLLSPKEVGANEALISNYVAINGIPEKGKDGYEYYRHLSDGFIYDYYLNEKNRIKKSNWWTRFPTPSNNSPCFTTITSSGYRGAGWADNLYGIIPAFCL